MASLYVFSCQGCNRKKAFASEHDAARDGWLLAIARHGNLLRHVVRCPACLPPWTKAIMDLPARASRPKPKEVK